MLVNGKKTGVKKSFGFLPKIFVNVKTISTFARTKKQSIVF